MINLVTFSTVFAMAGSIASGYLSGRLGAQKSLMAIFILWGICLSAAALVKTTHLFWLVGALVGAALGLVWTVLRALAIRLVPAEKIGEVFGLFNIVGYLSAAAGAIFWGLVLLFIAPWGELGYRIALFQELKLKLLYGMRF